MRMLLALVLAACTWPSAARACGGPATAELDLPLRPATAHLGPWLEGYDGFELHPAPLTRVLYAVRGTDPTVFTVLEQALYGEVLVDPGRAVETEAPLRAPSLSAFHAALAAGDPTGAHRAAASVVQQILDLPAPVAEPHASLLRRPVEYLEIEPQLTGLSSAEIADYFMDRRPPSGALFARASEVRDLPPARAAALLERDPRHPRAASLRWLRLRAEMSRDLADGWDAADLRANTRPGVFERLIGDTEAWLRDYPGHPLADYVRLSALRLHYLAGHGDAAWAILLEMYPRHPARVVNEMRFLILQGLGPGAVASSPSGGGPEGLEGGRIDPATLAPELASALLAELSLDADQWSALWRRTEKEPTAVWALPLQERLLWQLAIGNPGAIPEAFPVSAAVPSPAWARLRLVALMRAGRDEDAWAQTELMPQDAAFVAPIRAQIRLRRGDWVGAIQEPELDEASQRYLVRVLAPDAALKALLRDTDRVLAAEAALSLALRRRAATGRWKQGQKLLRAVDPERASLWKEAARRSRARDPDAVLATARWMRAQAGRIFLERSYDEIVWYRSLPMTSPSDLGDRRAPGLPFSAEDEWEATAGWLTRSFATYAALEGYARWLDRLDLSKPDVDLGLAWQVLGEADAAYNALLNYGSSDRYAWGSVVEDSEPAMTVRRVGREIRAAGR